MRFKGQLLVPTEPGPGLRVDLEVAGHHLAVESESGDLGAWPLEAVRVRRLEGDTFAMTVAGEDLHFIADDTISFAYTGMPAIERVSGPSRSRSRIRDFLGRRGSTSTPTGITAAVDEPAPPPPAEHPQDHTDLEVSEPEIVIEETDEEVIDVAAMAVEEPGPPAQTGPTPMPSSVETDESQTACPGVTSEGLPCRSPILSSSGYCYSHDPARSMEDGYRKAQEARARLKRKGTARLTRVYSRLEKAMRQVERGELEPDIAVAMAQIARTMCAILDLDEEPGDDPAVEPDS